MLHLNSFFVYNSLVFESSPRVIRIYTFSNEDVEQLQQFEITTIKDCETFYSHVTQLLDRYREEECMIAYNDEIESISTYSFISSNRLSGQRKERFNYLQSMQQLLEALHSHFSSLPSLTTTSFSSQISSIEKLTTKRISTLRENIYELKSTQTSQQSQLELKENMQKDIFKEIEEYKNNYLSHKKMYKKLEKKLSKSTLKITPLRNKIELYQRYISELETSLHYIKSSQKSSYLPTYQILLSLGLLYYSQKNSKSYKIQKIEEKIYAYKQKIEQLQTTILQLEQQKREIQQSIQHYAALCDDEEIERKEQELQEMYETIAHIKEKQNDVNSKREEYEFELDKVILTHQRCSHYSLSQLFQHVSNEAEFIKNQLDLYSQERANSLHNGYYYQK